MRALKKKKTFKNPDVLNRYKIQKKSGILQIKLIPGLFLRVYPQRDKGWEKTRTGLERSLNNLHLLHRASYKTHMQHVFSPDLQKVGYIILDTDKLQVQILSTGVCWFLLCASLRL